MLLHLPIAILATLSPITVSDSVPQFDIVRECRYEGGSTAIFDHCSQDETAALSKLKMEWAQFGGTDRKICMAATAIGGFTSYVELLTCLEMARDVATSNDSPHAPTPGLSHDRRGRTRLTRPSVKRIDIEDD